MTMVPDLPQTEMAIIELTNTFRKEQKLTPLKHNKQLAAAARWFAEYLARTGKFAHEADGRQPSDRTKAAGYRHCMVAENLASFLDSRGFRTRDLASQMVEGWKASPGHRRNLMQPNATEIGVAVVKAQANAPKYVSVQLLGRPDSYSFRFTIENAAPSEVSYTFAGKTHTIGPRYRITHTTCQPGPISFEQAGGWLSGSRLGIVHQPAAGVVFRIGQESGGRIGVTRELPAAAR